MKVTRFVYFARVKIFQIELMQDREISVKPFLPNYCNLKIHLNKKTALKLI